MKIVGKLTARTLIYFGAAEMSFVILLCYALAVANHHVKPWLPTISACGDHPPEQYPFRFGIMLGAMLLLVEAVAMHAAKMTSSVTYVLGAVAAVCLGVVSVVGANEDNVVHTTAAVVFFVFEDVASVSMTMDTAKRISRLSLAIKIISSTVAIISTIIRLMIVYDIHCAYLHSLLSNSDFPWLAVVEWSNTAAIVVFQVTLSEDIHNLWLAVVDSEGSQAAAETKTALTAVHTTTQLPVKSGGSLPPSNPLPRNKEVLMYLEKADP